MEAEILNEGYENDPRKNIHSIYVKEMIINPFAYVQPINYTMEAFVAPANFDPDAQELNIVNAFAAYPNANKKYIFSVGTSTTTGLAAVTGRSYAYAENGGAYTTIASGTITWTVGSTKRNVVVIDVATSVAANIPIGAIWGYCSSGIYSVSSGYNNQLKYVHCQNLNSLTNIPEFAFIQCFDLSGILKIPDNVYELNARCFDSCDHLTGLILHSGISSIGDYAFNRCSRLIGHLNIPESVISVGKSAFYYCIGFTNLTLNLGLKYIGEAAFSEWSSITSGIVIPNSVLSLGNHCFSYNNSRIGNAILSSQIEAIPSYMFYQTYNLTGGINIPPLVSIIGTGAFYQCISFTYLILPSTLATISDQSFYDCRSLQYINCFRNIPPSITSSSFQLVNKTSCILHVPVGSLAAYQAAPYWNQFTNIIADL